MPMQVVNSNGKINYSSSGYEFTSSNSVQEFNADISKGLDIQGPVNIEFTLDDSVVNVTVDDLKTFQKNFGIQTSSGNLTVNAGTGSAYQQSQEQPLQVRFYSDNDAKVNSASGYGGIVDAAYHNLKSSISTLTSPLQGFMSSGTGKVNEASARKNQQQHQPQPQPPQQQRNNQHQPQQHYQQQEQNRQQASPPPVIRRETSSNNGYNNYNPGRQQEHQQYHHQSYQQQNHQQNYGARYQHVQRNTCPRPSMISSATSLASSIIYAPFAASYKVAATSLDAATYVSKVATEKATMYAESIKTSTVQGAQVAKRVAETSINSTLPYMPSLIESPLRYTLSYLPLNITPKIGMVSFISVGHGKSKVVNGVISPIFLNPPPPLLLFSFSMKVILSSLLYMLCTLFSIVMWW